MKVKKPLSLPRWGLVESDGTEAKGIGLISQVDLKAGDVVLVEPGIEIVPESPQFLAHPMPCGAEYVNDEELHALCCGISTQVRLLHQDVSKLIGDGDFVVANATSEAALKDIINRPYRTPPQERMSECVKSFQDSPCDMALMQNVMQEAGRFFSDAHEVMDYEEEDSVCVYGVFSGLLNHSCQPNAELYVVPEEFDKTQYTESGSFKLWTHKVNIRLQVTRSVKEGEELTISYDPFTVPDGRDEYRRHIENKFMFNCRCQPCVAEEGDKQKKFLKDDVYRLWKVIEDIDILEGAEVYCRASHVLGGFAQLNFDHWPVVSVWELCAERAYSSCDMIRAWYFISRALRAVCDMYGGIDPQKKPQLHEILERREDIISGKGLDGDNMEGYSVLPPERFDMKQEGLEELMFGSNHRCSDMYYYCLRVVNGKVQEIGRKENDERLTTLRAARILIDAAGAARTDPINAEPATIKMHEMPLDELMALIEPETAQKQSKKKKKKKKKKRSKAQADDSSADNAPADEPGAAAAPGELSDDKQPKPPMAGPANSMAATADGPEDDCKFEDWMFEDSEPENENEWVTFQSKRKIRQQTLRSRESATQFRPVLNERKFGTPAEKDNFRHGQQTQSNSVDAGTHGSTRTRVVGNPGARLGSEHRALSVSAVDKSEFHKLTKPADQPVSEWGQREQSDTAQPPVSNEDFSSQLPPLHLPLQLEKESKPEVVVRFPADVQHKETSPTQESEKHWTVDMPEKQPGQSSSRLTAAPRFPFVCSSGDLGDVSKQAWLAHPASMETIRVNKARDIGHLLAAKDGYAVNNEGYVLSTRRDSVCGRVQGQRAVVDLEVSAARRARTHSFGNDQGCLDMLKLADVRESKEF